MFRERAGINSASLLSRSAWNHARYAKPSAAVEPTLYAGKVETTTVTLILDAFAVSASDIQNPRAFFRSLNGFNQQWRAYDEVLDEVKYTTDPVTEEELDAIPVWHKYAGRNVTGVEGREIALASMFELIPGQDFASRQRRDRFEGLLFDYRGRVVSTANTPEFNHGEILSYPTALASKEYLTGFLGEVTAQAAAILLDIPNADATVELAGHFGVLLQFGDDYFDWRKDWNDQRKRRLTSGSTVRPGENLFNATLEENSGEKAACEVIIFDNSKRTAVWAKEFAPNTLDLFRQRFQVVADATPEHPKRENIKDIVEFAFYKCMPKAPEFGPVARWAKY